MLEFIHNLVETLDKYFSNVCELDVTNTTTLIVVVSYPLLRVDYVQHRKGTLYSGRDDYGRVHCRMQ